MSDGRACPFEDDVLVLEDGDLPFERRIVVEAHLGICAECAALEEALDRGTTVLRALDDAPLGAAARALDSLASRRRPVRLVAAGAAAAAGLFVALVLQADDAEPQLPADGAPVAAVPIPEARPALEVPAPSSAGATLFERLAAVSPDDAEALDRIARFVRKGGAARGAQLGRALRSPDRDHVLRALAVAERAPSSQLVAPLVALLDEVEDAEVGVRAARLLGEMGAPQAVAALTAALDGPSASDARDALARLESAAAYDALSRRARTVPAAECQPLLSATVRASPATGARLLLELAADDETRPAAWSVLASRRAELLPSLRALASGSEALVAAAAAEALGRARDEESVALLAELAERRVTDRAAAMALLRIGSEESIAAAVAAASARPEIIEAFDGVRAAESMLVEAVEEGGAESCRAAIALLARCGGEQAVAALGRRRLPRAHHAEAVAALGEIGGAAAVAALAEYGGDPILRDDVIAALGATGSPAAVPALRALARRGEARRVARALALVHHEDGARELIEMLRTGPASSDAAEALAAMPARVVVPVLIEALDDPQHPRRLRRILARIAGVDHGASPRAWRNWWETHS